MGTMIYHVENPAPGLEVGQAQNVVGLNQLMGSQPDVLPYSKEFLYDWRVHLIADHVNYLLVMFFFTAIRYKSTSFFTDSLVFGGI